MEFSLDKEKKIEAYKSVLLNLENGIILRLGVLGIDPDTFDENQFVPREDSTAENDIYKILSRIKKIKDKIKEIELT
jgi:hypothetical protein